MIFYSRTYIDARDFFDNENERRQKERKTLRHNKILADMIQAETISLN